MGYSPCGCRESDITDFHFHTVLHSDCASFHSCQQSRRGPPSPSPWLAGKALESPRSALLAFPGTPKVGATPLARGFLPRPPPYPHPRGDGEKGKLCPTPGLREQVCDLNKDLVSKNITKKKKR